MSENLAESLAESFARHLRITITMTLDPELADHHHPMGVTEAAHDALQDALSAFGSDIEVTRADEPA